MTKSILHKIASIEQQIRVFQQQEKQLFATSSFQTHSLPMLHIISRIDPTIPVYFINTGFHFPETISFRDQIANSFGLNLIDLHPMVPKNLQKDAQGNLYFTSDPDYCCFLNKTQPLNTVLLEKDVWINGIRADQNANRKNMHAVQKSPNETLRYHPMLDWTNKMIFAYIKEYNLPKHPLEEKGYLSIGCEPCTRKFDFSEGREGRWFGMKKTECGLHTDLAKKS